MKAGHGTAEKIREYNICIGREVERRREDRNREALPVPSAHTVAMDFKKTGSMHRDFWNALALLPPLTPLTPIVFTIYMRDMT